MEIGSYLCGQDFAQDYPTIRIEYKHIQALYQKSGSSKDTELAANQLLSPENLCRHTRKGGIFLVAPIRHVASSPHTRTKLITSPSADTLTPSLTRHQPKKQVSGYRINNNSHQHGPLSAKSSSSAATLWASPWWRWRKKRRTWWWWRRRQRLSVTRS